MAKGAGTKAGPIVTDNGNFVIDAPFDEQTMRDPYSVRTHLVPNGSLFVDAVNFPTSNILQLLKKIKMLTGVVEVGLFCGMAQAAYFGNAVSTVILIDPLFTNVEYHVSQDGTVTIKWQNGDVENTGTPLA